MSVTLHLAPEIERQLQQKAAENGLTLEAYVRRIAEQEVHPPANGAPPSAEAEEEDDDERPWRGVLCLPVPRKILFTGLAELPDGKLPYREAVPNMNFHRVRDDDE